MIEETEIFSGTVLYILLIVFGLLLFLAICYLIFNLKSVPP